MIITKKGISIIIFLTFACFLVSGCHITSRGLEDLDPTMGTGETKISDDNLIEEIDINKEIDENIFDKLNINNELEEEKVDDSSPDIEEDDSIFKELTVTGQSGEETVGEMYNFDNWIGEYSFEEFSPPNQMMFYNITIFKEGDKHYANIYIDGFQTMQRLQARLIQTEMYVSLAFDKYLPDNLYEPYEKGDILLSFIINNSGELITDWGKIQPMLLSNQEEGVYFIKNEAANTSN